MGSSSLNGSKSLWKIWEQTDAENKMNQYELKWNKKEPSGKIVNRTIQCSECKTCLANCVWQILNAGPVSFISVDRSFSFMALIYQAYIFFWRLMSCSSPFLVHLNFFYSHFCSKKKWIKIGCHLCESNGQKKISWWKHRFFIWPL